MAAEAVEEEEDIVVDSETSLTPAGPPKQETAPIAGHTTLVITPSMSATTQPRATRKQPPFKT